MAYANSPEALVLAGGQMVDSSGTVITLFPNRFPGLFEELPHMHTNREEATRPAGNIALLGVDTRIL